MMLATSAISPFQREHEAVPTSRAGVDRSALLSLAGVFLAALLAWAAYGFFLPDSMAALNLWMPLSMAAICFWGVVNLVRSNALWMWSPLVSLLTACAVYHGLGPLLHVLGDPKAVNYVNQFARIDAEDLAATNLLNLVSLTLILLSCCAFSSLASTVLSGRRISGLRIQTKGFSGVTWGLIGVSLPLKYLVVLPYFLGWTDPGFVLPGFVVVLGNLSFLCLFLLFYQAWTRNPLFYIPATLLCLLEIATGLLAFNKTEIITTLGVCFLGLYLARPSKQLAAGAISLIAVAYFLITPIVSKGRVYLKANPATVNERLEALESAWNGDEVQSPGNVQGWWTRLCYANAQSFAMHQYEAGMNGRSFDLILPALVPRVLWPDKPIMTPGFEFNELATGNKRSSSAPGIFAEAYWNYGWAGVLGACAYLGILLHALTEIAFYHVARRDLRWLPFGVGGLITGASVTDWFASTYVGGVLTIGLYLLVVKTMVPAAGTQPESSGVQR